MFIALKTIIKNVFHFPVNLIIEKTFDFQVDKWKQSEIPAFFHFRKLFQKKKLNSHLEMTLMNEQESKKQS